MWYGALVILTVSILASFMPAETVRPADTNPPPPVPDLKVLVDAVNEAAKGTAAIWFFLLRWVGPPIGRYSWSNPSGCRFSAWTYLS